jgi:hypothetical protein
MNMLAYFTGEKNGFESLIHLYAENLTELNSVSDLKSATMSG